MLCTNKEQVKTIRLQLLEATVTDGTAPPPQGLPVRSGTTASNNHRLSSFPASTVAGTLSDDDHLQ